MLRRPAWSLLAVALLATAGCLGAAPSADEPPSSAEAPAPTPTASPTTAGSLSPTGSPSPAGSPSPDSTPSFEPVSFEDGPKEPPARPDELDGSSVAAYVRTHEYRYLYNQLWVAEDSEVSVDCEVESVTALEAGYRAVVTCSGSSTTWDDASASTRTPLHGDLFDRTAVYRVTDDETLRRQADEVPPARTATPSAPPIADGSSSPADGDSSSPAGSPSPGGTPAFEAVSFEDGPKEPPARPEELTGSSVANYARTYEYRYVYNLLWYDEHSDVDLECETNSVVETDEGYRAVVTCSGYSNTGGNRSGNATATTLHADWFTRTFVYRVTDDETLRRRATEDERPA